MPRWTGLIVFLMAAVPASAQAPASGLRATAGKPAAVIDTSELMDIFLEPMYDELKQALETMPADRKGWAAIYRSAVKLAEVNNLLFFRTPGRYTDHPEWPAMSAAARQSAADLAAATFVALRNTKAESFAPLKARLGDVAESCNACHRAVKVDAKTIKP